MVSRIRRRAAGGDDMGGPGTRAALQRATPDGTDGPSDRMRTTDDAEQLGRYLAEHGVLSPSQLSQALREQSESGKPLAAVLVASGTLDERTVARALATHAAAPFVDLRREQVDPDAVRRVPEALARSLGVVPVRIDADSLEVAVADPTDPLMADELARAVAPLRLVLLVAPPSDIQHAMNAAYHALAGVASYIEAFESSEAGRRADGGTSTRVVSDDAPVVQVMNRLVAQGVRDRASDVHIEPQANRVRVRFRIDGALHDVLALPESMGPAVVNRLKIMANMNIVDRRRAQDGQVVMEVDGRFVDIRIATAPTIWGEKAVLRLLDRNRTLHRLDDLGMPAEVHGRFSQMVRAPYGMVICAGPTGSGKTTTLYATLTEINQPDRNITTIEDPVEYVFSSINQIQINEQAGVNFASGLRSILRQDPDVILVGEIRDAETARIAVESALTGHFVLSSIHATDACSALQRFVDMGIEPFLIASTVTGVVSQRLVRRICDECRVRYEPTVEELAFYAQAGGRVKTGARADADGDDGRFTRGEGCNFCSHTGYRDRTGVFELLRMSDDIKSLLVAGAALDLLRAQAQREGMRSLLDGGIQLVDHDITTIAEIMRGIYVL